MTTTNQPTPVIIDEAALAEIEARECIAIGWGRWVQLRPEERDALCQTVRALRVQVAQAEQAFELESAVKLSEVGHLNVLQIVKKMAALHEENTTLREQLAESSRRHLADILSLQRERREALDRLAQVEQERERLLRGEFTTEEFQNLCHNTDVQAGFDAFADGCEAYQQKLFGRCRKGTTT